MSRGMVVAAVVAAVVASVVVAGVTPAVAARGNPVHCDAGVDLLTNQNIGTEVPVVLVHGWSGKPADWGSISEPADFAGMVDRLPGVAVAHLFKYNTNVWVDHSDSGPKLAKTIDCVSQLSQRNGGKGKVVVIGYSMGGLVARDALSRRSTDGQRAIADETGQVVTVGTPHVGTTLPLAGAFLPFTLLPAFLPGSAELTRLPHFPSQTVVRTVAGDVVRVFHDRRGNEEKREQPFDDTLVTTLSAHDQYSIDVNRGGGSATFTCEKRYRAQGLFGRYKADKDPVPCEHGQLIQTANNGVREDVSNAINKYVASLSSVKLTVGALTMSFDAPWENPRYGMIRGIDATAKDTTSGVPCTRCTTQPNPTTYAFVDMWYRPDCVAAPPACAVDGSSVIGAAPAVTIGGRAPDYSARFLDSGYAGTSFVWCFTDQKVCVYYRRAADRPQLETSPALLDVFRSATWSG